MTHLHDDHLIVDDASRAYAREHDLPYFRGGIVEHGGGGHPVLEAIYTPAGRTHTRSMLDSPMRDRLWVFTMQGEDLPQATNRIDLDPSVRDVHGFAAGRVTFDAHRHELVASQYAVPILQRVLEVAGAESTFVTTSPASPTHTGSHTARLAPNSKHTMGTCRMGTDARTSVVDPYQRSWDVENLLITDSSVFPTSTGYGPTLTIVALALRAARALV